MKKYTSFIFTFAKTIKLYPNQLKQYNKMIKNTRILLVAALLKITSLLVKPTGAIIGGAAVTDFSAYSWMGYVDVYDPVTLKHRSSCGGTVIDPQYILTSAHCFFNAGHSQPANFSIISLGTGKSKFDYPKERVEVQGFPRFYNTLYGGYSRRRYHHDVAIIKLDAPIDFVKYPQIGKLEVAVESEQPLPYTCYVVGWGKSESANITAELRVARYPILPDDTCQTVSRYFNRTVSYCAGPKESDKPPGSPNICKGDSGGPLVCQVKGTEATQKQFGIISFKKGVCDKHKWRPAFLSRLPYYATWILNNQF